MPRFLALVLIFCAYSVTAFFYNVCHEKNSCRSRLLTGKGTAMDDGLAFCTCPMGQECSDDNSVVFKNTRYSFCQPIEVPHCRDGQLSLEIQLLVTSVHCKCADGFILREMAAQSKSQRFKKAERYANLYFECVADDGLRFK